MAYSSYKKLDGYLNPCFVCNFLQNKTVIFNIYGITEVSSWATCYQVTADDDCDSPTTVPLGSPLLGTRVELRDEDGMPIDKGSGFIWIGK